MAVSEVRRDREFVVATGTGEYQAPALVVATGGLSIPKMGATGFGYDLARQFGLRVRPTRPALVPLVLDAEDRRRYCDLTGVAADVVASAAGQQFREHMLITHQGLSGPAILQASSYWHAGEAITIDLAPGVDVTAGTRASTGARSMADARAALRAVLPNRLADRWLELHAPEGWSNSALERFEHQLHHWALMPAGTEGFAKAEVTAGGVDTDELSAKTLESRRVPGLYFIGEVVDVTGQLGGFNFQWAWASGTSAGWAV